MRSSKGCRYPFTTKFIALVTAFAMGACLPGAGYSFVATSAATLGLGPEVKATGVDPTFVDIPGEWGTIEETFQGHTGRMVVYIQDAHDSHLPWHPACGQGIQGHNCLCSPAQ